MAGSGADVSGQPEGSAGGVGWRDGPDKIGVNYLSPLTQLADGNWSERLEAIAVRDTKALQNRRTIHAAARALAAKQRETATETDADQDGQAA